MDGEISEIWKTTIFEVSGVDEMMDNWKSVGIILIKKKKGKKQASVDA